MRARLVLVGALGCLIAVAGAACGRGEEAAPTPPTTEEADPPAESQPAESIPATETDAGSSPGNVYVETLFQPAFTLDLGGSYSSSPGPAIALIQVGASGEFGLSFLNDLVLRADPGTEHADDPISPDEGENAAADLATWLLKHPRLEATDPEPATIAGHEGVQFDVTVKEEEAYDNTWCGPQRCVILFDHAGAGYFLAVGSPMRVISLDVDGEEVLMLVEALDPAEFDTWTAMAAEILETLSFE